MRIQHPSRARVPGLALVALLLGACASEPRVPYSTNFDATADLPSYAGSVTDGRGRFREIFCTILREREQDTPDHVPCDEALMRIGIEPAGTGAPVPLGQSKADYLIGVVPGLGWACFKGWLDHQNYGPEHVAQFGYESAFLDVDGLSSTEKNANQINEFLLSLTEEDDGRPLILMGYSKGAPDLLDFLVRYPETAERVVAVVSLAGAVGGSALATEDGQKLANFLTNVPKSECDTGDEGAVRDLQPAVRQQWLAEHTLPDHIRYYSVVTYPDPDTRISRGLRSSYNDLSALVDARNDSQVVYYDQLLPDSTLLAFANADHWALAVPVSRTHEFVTSTFVNRNQYPREALYEAILRYIEEDLSNWPADP